MELVTPGLGLIFWQTITFIVLLIVLGKFAWKPITNSLREREASIENALRTAEQARAEMAQLKAENEKLLDAARVERDNLLKKAQQTADAIVEESKNRATAESNKIVEGAKLAINAERQAALQSIKNQVAILSVEIAEKLIRVQLKDEQSQKQLVNQLVNDVKLS